MMAGEKNDLKTSEAEKLERIKSQADKDFELSENELDEVAGGKLPGKRTPPTLTLKRGKNYSL